VLPIGEDVEGNDVTWDEFFKDLMNGKFDKLAWNEWIRKPFINWLYK